MKILLINNHTEHLDSLAKALEGHDVEMQVYMPGIHFNTEGKDLVILSGGGGEGMEIDDHYERGKLWYQQEIEFVRNYNRPLLGICMGFEIICKAFGERVNYMGKLIQGFKPIYATDTGYAVTGHKHLKQFEAHSYKVPYVSEENFEVLARSDEGVEMIKHKQKPFVATQFHPEKGGTLHLNQLLRQFA
jgi:anthranilate/para-aminobenzoate synthase component II